MTQTLGMQAKGLPSHRPQGLHPPAHTRLSPAEPPRGVLEAPEGVLCKPAHSTECGMAAIASRGAGQHTVGCGAPWGPECSGLCTAGLPHGQHTVDCGARGALRVPPAHSWPAPWASPCCHLCLSPVSPPAVQRASPRPCLVFSLPVTQQTRAGDSGSVLSFVYMDVFSMRAQFRDEDKIHRMPVIFQNCFVGCLMCNISQRRKNTSQKCLESVFERCGHCS